MYCSNLHSNIYDVSRNDFGKEILIRVVSMGNTLFDIKGPTLLILTYNVGDTVGKYIGGFRQIYNEIIQIIILFMRFGFFITFYMIVVGVIKIK